MIVKKHMCERGTMRHKISDKATYVKLWPQLLEKKVSSSFISLALNITCLNIAEVLLPRYKLRKICHRELVSNLVILGTPSNVTFFIIVRVASSFLLILSIFSPTFFPFYFATKYPWRYSTHPTVSDCTQTLSVTWSIPIEIIIIKVEREYKARRTVTINGTECCWLNWISIRYVVTEIEESKLVFLSNS